MNLIKTIELIFENCEVMEINRNEIGVFALYDVETFICRTACNAINKYQVANTFAIEIFSEGNAEHIPFGISKYSKRRFDRIKAYNDITGIDIIYDNGNKEHYLTNFDDPRDIGDNSNQKVYISELGNLYLVIAAGKDIEDFFDLDYINNKEEIDFTKDMYDIGIKEEPEHEYNEDSVPDMYRYVYLDDGKTNRLAIRVYDPDCEWKFVFEGDRPAIHFPKKWSYADEKMVQFFDEHNEEFTVVNMMKKYPPKESYNSGEQSDPMYCDRNICLQNEYNEIGCKDCEVTKSQKEE